MSSPVGSTVCIALEAIECSNRCRHCEVHDGPRRRHLSRDEIGAWADDVRRQAERLGVTVEIGLYLPVFAVVARKELAH